MRASVASLTKKLISTFFAATLALGLVPMAAFADDGESTKEEAVSLPVGDIINEEVPLETVVAQTEATTSYFLAQTLESTKTIPMVSASLPLGGDSEEEGDDQLPATSVAIGSYTYRGITYAVEPGGETVAVVAADYTKLPEDFIEAKAIVLPSMVTPDSIDYYSVTHIADYAFSSLTADNCRRLIHVAPDGEDATEDEAAKGEDSNSDSETFGIDAITVPATVTEIGDNAFTDFNTLQYIIVVDGNPVYGMYDGCLYDASLSQLRLIPEGRLGAVRVAPSVTEVTPEAFSHCPSVDTLVADPDSAAYQLFAMGGFRDKDDALEVLTMDEAKERSVSFYQEKYDVSELSLLEPMVIGEPFESSISLRTTYEAVSVASGPAAQMKALANLKANGFTILDYRNRTGVIAEVVGATTATNKWTLGVYSPDDYYGIGFYKPVPAAKAYPPGTAATHSTRDNVVNGDYRLTGNTAFWETQAPGLFYFDSTIGFYAKGNSQWYTRQPTVRGAGSEVIMEGWIAAYKADGSTITDSVNRQTLIIFPPPYDYIITWNSNGGSSVSSWSVPNGDNKKVSDSPSYASNSYSLPSPTRTGHTFAGWYTTTSYSTRVYSTTAITGDVTFYAKWNTASYSINWYTDHGTKPTKTSYTYGSSYTLPTLSETGYTWGGWYTSSSYTTKASNITSSTTGSKSFYGKWTANTYTVRYNGNGGKTSSNSATATSSHTYDKEKNLTANPFQKTGMVFKGWATTQARADEGTVDYIDEAEVKNLATDSGAIVDLYAVWGPDSYTVRWFDEDGSPLHDDVTVRYDDTITMPAGPVKEGSRFMGWKADTTGKTYEDATVAVSEVATGADSSNTIVFRPAWTHADYEFVLVDNGYGLNENDKPVASDDKSVASFTVSTGDTLTKGANAKFATNAPSRNGYDLVGFYWHPGQSDEVAFWVSDSEYVEADPVKPETDTGWAALPCFEPVGDGTKKVALEAVWQPIVYTIVWDYDWNDAPGAYVYQEDGKAKEPVTTTVAYGSPVEVPSVIDPGYGFEGWKAGKAEDDAVAARPKVVFSDGRTDVTPETYSDAWFRTEGTTVLFEPATITLVADRDKVRFYAHFSDEPTLFPYRVYLSVPGEEPHGAFSVNSLTLAIDDEGVTYYSDTYEYGKGADLSALKENGRVIAWDNGWTLIGFTEDADATDEPALAAPDPKATGMKVYYAVWSADDFSVTLVLDTVAKEQGGETVYFAPVGANIDGATTKVYAFGYDTEDDALMRTFPTPTGAVGYHFRGWRLIDGEGSFVENAPVIEGIPSVGAYLDSLFEDRIADTFAHARYGAVWEPYSYEVVFHANRSATDDESNTVRATYGEDLLFPAPYTKSTGYIFRVWQPTAGLYSDRYANWRAGETIAVERFVARWSEATGRQPEVQQDGSYKVDLYANWCQPVSADVALTVNVLLDPWNPHAERGKVIMNDSKVNDGMEFALDDGARVNAWVATDKDYTNGSFGDGNAYALRVEALTFLPAGEEAGDAMTTAEVFTKTATDGTKTDRSRDFKMVLYAGGKKEGSDAEPLTIPLSSGRLELSRSDLSAYGLDATIKRGDPLYLYYDLDIGTEMTLEKYERLMEIMDKMDTKADGTTYRLSRPIAHFYYTIGLVPLDEA